MWIFLNNAMLSVVQKSDQPEGTLTVRARARADINRVIPSADVKYTPGLHRDYAYRAIVPRAEVAKAIANAIKAIDYSNFKDSVPKDEHDRHFAYSGVWSEMFNFQEDRLGRRYQATRSVPMLTAAEGDYEPEPPVTSNRWMDWFNSIKF